MSAPTIELTTLANGNRTAKILIRIPAGGDADVTATKVADASTLGADVLGILQVIGGLNGFSCDLWFDASTDDFAMTVPPGSSQVNLKPLFVNGLPNPLSSGYTGDIMLTTNGIAAADDDDDDNVGFIILEVSKS